MADVFHLLFPLLPLTEPPSGWGYVPGHPLVPSPWESCSQLFRTRLLIQGRQGAAQLEGPWGAPLPGPSSGEESAKEAERHTLAS